MKAPTDKSNDIIQVVITRRCDLRNCSNCTQLLPYRTDVPSMSPDCFRKALRSLKGWPGIRGVFGGNPCSHPRFAELMEILVEEVPLQRQRGLWSNNLLGHGELVRRVFWPQGRFNLNAHANPSAAAEIDRWLPGKLIPASRDRAAWHGPILMDRKDLGVSDEAWEAARESCDINVHWSSAIAERAGEPFAYFCEVGAALDGVRGENHGIPAEPGWWRFKMDRFEEQVRGCCDRGCGVPLRLKGHLDRDDTYDISPSWQGATEARPQAKPSTQLHSELPADKAVELTDYLRIRSSAR